MQDDDSRRLHTIGALRGQPITPHSVPAPEGLALETTAAMRAEVLTEARRVINGLPDSLAHLALAERAASLCRDVDLLLSRLREPVGEEVARVVAELEARQEGDRHVGVAYGAPDALCAEAASLLRRLSQSAAEERGRIVAMVRSEAETMSNLDEKAALLWMANKIDRLDHQKKDRAK